MIEQIASPTYSISSNALKLNSSSIVCSTPDNNAQKLEGPLVVFEEITFDNQKQKPHTKKHLTIEVDQLFEFPEQSKYKSRTSFDRERHTTDRHSKDNKTEQKLKQYSLQQQLELQISQNQNLVTLMQAAERKSNQCQKDSQEMKQTLQRKEQIIKDQQHKIDHLIYKMAQIEQTNKQQNFYDEKLREKEIKIKEIQRHNQKIVNLNKILQKELRQSDRKIMQLEKDLQKNLCNTQMQHLQKIKDGSNKMKDSKQKELPSSMLNKQNMMGINSLKSLEKRKNSALHNKKTGRVSSIANLSKKLTKL